jgi:hypothetical protein
VIRVFALDVEAAKNIAVAIIAGSVIIAILTAMFVRAALTKALVILLLGGLVVVMVGQRFLGREFSVEVPEGVGSDVIGDITDVIDDEAPTSDAGAPTSTGNGEVTPELVDMPEG